MTYTYYIVKALGDDQYLSSNKQMTRDISLARKFTFHYSAARARIAAYKYTPLELEVIETQ